jgi:DNA modification methylase
MKRIRELLEGDCLDLLPNLPDNCVDLIAADLPYGKTKDPFDIIIPPEKLWPEYWRVIKPNGAIVLFGQDKFTAMMMLSDKNHRYNLIWDKVLVSAPLNANRMPLRSHEDIMLFYKKLPTYNPQKTKGVPCHSRGKAVGEKQGDRIKNQNYGDFNVVETQGDMKHPKSILTFQKPHPSKALHRTEKPVKLLEWIIKTYSNEGEIVLDNVAGSGTTGEACDNTNRQFILMEKNPVDCDTIKKRLNIS